MGSFWRSKSDQNSSVFLIDFPIDFLLILEAILGAVWYIFGIFVDVSRDNVKTRKMARRAGESTNMEGCEGPEILKKSVKNSIKNGDAKMNQKTIPKWS